MMIVTQSEGLPQLKVSPEHFDSERVVSYLPKKSKKTVTFKPTARLKRHIHTSEFSEDEIQQCWYGREDFDSFKKDISATLAIMRMMGDKMKDTDDFCAGGLHKYLNDDDVFRRREEAWDTVAAVQLDQYERDVRDPEEMAAFYAAACKASGRIARKRAKDLAKDCRPTPQASTTRREQGLVRSISAEGQRRSVSALKRVGGSFRGLPNAIATTAA